MNTGALLGRHVGHIKTHDAALPILIFHALRRDSTGGDSRNGKTASGASVRQRTNQTFSKGSASADERYPPPMSGRN